MQNKNILIGVTGGIAIYKICGLVRMLVKKDFSVKVVMTGNATKLVSPLVFQSLSRSIVYTDTFALPKTGGIEHISLAKWANAALVAPATANTIGKIACGIADNLLTTIVMALPESVPLTVAPAMNANMWNSIFVQKNMDALACRKNCRIVGPKDGMLADGTSGMGRMADPETILAEIEKMAGNF